MQLSPSSRHLLPYIHRYTPLRCLTHDRSVSSTDFSAHRLTCPHITAPITQPRHPPNPKLLSSLEAAISLESETRYGRGSSSVIFRIGCGVGVVTGWVLVCMYVVLRRMDNAVPGALNMPTVDVSHSPPTMIPLPGSRGR